MARRTAETAASVFGASDRRTLYQRWVIATILGDLGRHEDALSLAQSVADQQAANVELGPTHSSTLITLATVADELLSLHRYDEALALAQRLVREYTVNPALDYTGQETAWSGHLVKQIEQAIKLRNNKLAVKPVLPHAQRPRKAGRGDGMAKDDRIVTKGGIKYLPLSVASDVCHTPRQTLLNWIKNRTKFAGRILQSYHSSTAGKYYVSEESVRRIASRFVRWPSNAPAGDVTLGETEDQTGFIPLSSAARILGVSGRTMWLWASQDKAPSEKALDVIKCTASDHFYVRQKDVSELKSLVPRSGLQRGRRARPEALRT